MDSAQVVTSVETTEEVVEVVLDAPETEALPSDEVLTSEQVEVVEAEALPSDEDLAVEPVEAVEAEALPPDEDLAVEPVEATEAEALPPTEDLAVEPVEAVEAEALPPAEDPIVEPVEVAEAEMPPDEDSAVEPADAAEMGELAVEDWDYQQPKRGQVRMGVILAIHEQEIIVDVGVKRDGIVPSTDLQRLGPEAIAELSVGDEVPVYIMRPEDQDGNLLVSLNMARQEKAWIKAQGLADSGEVLEGQVIGFNKGGLVLPVDEIRGFIPASQVPGFPQGLSQDDRLNRLADMVGETLQVKVIEINKRKRRLILSATAAQHEWRQLQRERLLADLREGEVRTGVVSSLCPFGAFVDLGGADGLVHLSELSWRRVRHPREVLKVGQEVEVYVLRLDHEKNRIGLSVKRLQPEPWALVEDKYELGQLVEGVVTNVVDFGAFAEIEDGVEGLIHVSELADGQISHPRDVVKKGDLLLLRIIRVDTRRKRLGLSLKRVLESEWAEWAATLAVAEEDEEPVEPLEDVIAEAPEEAVEAVAEEVEEPAELSEDVVVEVSEEVVEATAEEVEELAELPEDVAAEAPEEIVEAAAEEVEEPAELPEDVVVEVSEEVVEATAEEVEKLAELPEDVAAEAPEEVVEAAAEEVEELAELPEGVAAGASEEIVEAAAEEVEEPAELIEDAVEAAADEIEEVEEPEALADEPVVEVLEAVEDVVEEATEDVAVEASEALVSEELEEPEEVESDKGDEADVSSDSADTSSEESETEDTEVDDPESVVVEA